MLDTLAANDSNSNHFLLPVNRTNMLQLKANNIIVENPLLYYGDNLLKL